MSSTHLFLLSLAAMFAGVLLLVLNKSESMAGMLIATALGALGGAKVAHSKERETRKERVRADDAEDELSKTQTILHRVLRHDPPAPPPAPPTA